MKSMVSLKFSLVCLFVFSFISFMACQFNIGSGNDNNPTDLTKDSLKIRSVTPNGNLTANIAQDITIVVDYNLNPYRKLRNSL